MSDEPIKNAPLSAEEQDEPAEERTPDEEGSKGGAPPTGSGDEGGEE